MAIGASAGGLEAMTALLGRLPVDSGMAFVIVQHLDPSHESALTALLSKTTTMPVREVADGILVEPDHVYVIPPNTTMALAGCHLHLLPRTGGPHRPIDAFFESLARERHEGAIGVVLSGSATDGTIGSEAIKAEGGITFAQDDTAKYDSMPRSAVAAGCVDFILPPERIALELVRIARHPYVAGKDLELSEGAAGETTHDGLKQILLLLRKHSGVDFSLYKATTIQRRITRRMMLSKHDTFAAYARALRGEPHELDTLFSDVLIGVTGFFRNPEAFDALKQKVFPRLFARRREAGVRAWVLGCSSGQEPYSIAMAFIEAAEAAQQTSRLQLFATDLNNALLDKARAGLYSRSDVDELSPARIRRFFVEEQGGFRINKSLRDMCVFARQNLIGDPPFSRMDLVSCRNLLIYLEPSLQKRVLPSLHYALAAGGFLLLGASESVSSFGELFETVDRKHRIFAKRPVATPVFRLPIRGMAASPPPPDKADPDEAPLARPVGVHSELDAQREADRLTVSRYAPPGVLINDELQVLQFRGSSAAYLTLPTGKASFDLLKMARSGLMAPLRNAIAKARSENKPVEAIDVRIAENGHRRSVNLRVLPLTHAKERTYLVLFEEDGKPADAAPEAAPTPNEPGRQRELERELADSTEYAQALQERYESANEELQAANEEIQSANEELQSINEELETSKEELESTNEELTTVNEEMITRNAELSRLNSDLSNLQLSIQTAILLLGRDLTIRRFTPLAEKLFNLLPTDVGRSIDGIKHNLDLPDLGQLVSDVVHARRPVEREVLDKDGRWYGLRVRPYVSLDNKADGAVVVLSDIDLLKRSEQRLLRERDYARAVIGTTRMPFLVLDENFEVDSANEAFYRTFQTTAEATEGRRLFELSNGQWDVPALREAMEGILLRDVPLDDFEISHQIPGSGVRHMVLNGRRLRHVVLTPPMILLSVDDITDRVRSVEAAERERHARRDSERIARIKDDFLTTLSHELRSPLNAVLGWTRVLKMKAGDQPELANGLDIIERNARAQADLVTDLLDMSAIASGKLRLTREAVDLAEVARDAVERHLPAATAKGIRIELTAPRNRTTSVDGDRGRLVQSISNLLSNAVKFNPAGGKVEVRVGVEGERAVVTVKDGGQGIAPDFLPVLFDRFRQAESGTARRHGGLGLGLALLKNLVELHGGTVEAESPGEGLGATFRILLPLSSASAARSERRNASSVAPDLPALEGLKVLVVDDDDDSCALIERLLMESGLRAVTAHSAAKGFERLKTERPDLVLCDIGMPGEDGYAFIERVRSSGDGTPAIAVTAFARPEDRERALSAGFQDHLPKPIAYPQLLSAIAAVSKGWHRPRRRKDDASSSPPS